MAKNEDTMHCLLDHAKIFRLLQTHQAVDYERWYCQNVLIWRILSLLHIHLQLRFNQYPSL